MKPVPTLAACDRPLKAKWDISVFSCEAHWISSLLIAHNKAGTHKDRVCPGGSTTPTSVWRRGRLLLLLWPGLVSRDRGDARREGESEALYKQARPGTLLPSTHRTTAQRSNISTAAAIVGHRLIWSKFSSENAQL